MLVALLGVLVVGATAYGVYAASQPSPDFALASSTAAPLYPTDATVFTLTETPANGFSGSVALSVSGLPKATSATFVTNPLTSSTKSTSVIVTAGSAAATGTYTLTFTGKSGSLTHSATAQLVIANPTSFYLTINPAENTGVGPGSAATYLIQPKWVSGSGSVTLSTNSDLPAGVTASFSPNPNSAGASTLTLQTSASTPLGSFPFAVKGVSGSVTTWDSLILDVGSYGVSVTPSSQTVISGTGTTYNVAVNRSGVFSSNVSLSVAGLPTGATGSFSPNPVLGPSGSSSVLTVQTNAATVQPGTYTLTITGSGGTPTQTKTAQVTLQINPLNLTIGGSGTSATLLYPGASPTPINVTFSNPNGVSLPLTALTVAIQSVSGPNINAQHPCTTADYAVSQFSGSTPLTIPAGSSNLQGLGVLQAKWPTVRMVNSSSNQNGCAGATVTLAYTGSVQG